jgi:hypothetical protein
MLNAALRHNMLAVAIAIPLYLLFFQDFLKMKIEKPHCKILL